MVSETILDEFLASSTHKPKLVFIAACTSEKIGKLFQRHGVEHIICIGE